MPKTWSVECVQLCPEDERFVRVAREIAWGEAPPSETALYDRLAGRMREAMLRAGLAPWQMTIVADEFFRASLELVEAMPDDPPPQVPAKWVTATLACRACRRTLGTVDMNENEVDAARERVVCDGCLREGR